MSEKLSLTQRIQNAVGSQEVEKVHGIHSYLHGKANAREEWGTIWATSDDCSWAHAFGRMRGFDEVWYNSVTLYDMYAYESFTEMEKIFPEIGGMDPRPIMELSMHTIVNGIVEVAEDGKSARSSYVTPGILYDRINHMQVKRCMNFWERYGADFVCDEDGRWLYLHEHVCPDFGMPLDVANNAEREYGMLKNPPKDMPPRPPQDRDSRVRLTDKGPLHHSYSLLQPVQNTVPYPEPYKKLDNQNTYAQWPGYDD